MVNNCINFIQRLWPRQCLLCLQTGSHTGLCHDCLPLLTWNRHACRRCATPLPAGLHRSLCGQCLKQPPPFHAAHAPLLYAHPVDYLVRQLKFHQNLACARLLGETLAQSIVDSGVELPEVLLPVPLHPARLRERGFNQAVELARPLSRRLGIPLDLASCHRHRATRAQSDLPLSQRRANIEDAFAVRRAVTARHVAIVDDVMTSGQTAAALARVLLGQGVERVSLWCCARTVLRQKV